MAHRGLRAQAMYWLTGWTATMFFLAWIGVFLQMPLAAELRGDVMPVVTRINVISTRPFTMPDGRSAVLIRAEAVKMRDCGFRHLDWFLVADGGETSITAFFLDPPAVRPRGIIQWEGLVVGVDPARLSSTRATVRHRCWLGPVDTVFFTGADS